MNKKEIEIQIALGTLSLWQRIKLNLVELEEEDYPWIYGITKMSCEGKAVAYKRDLSGKNRESAIRRLIDVCKRYGV